MSEIQKCSECLQKNWSKKTPPQKTVNITPLLIGCRACSIAFGVRKEKAFSNGAFVLLFCVILHLYYIICVYNIIRWDGMGWDRIG